MPRLTPQPMGFSRQESSEPPSPLPQVLRIPHFFSLGDKATLEDVLQRSYDLFLEIGNRQNLEHTLACIMEGAPDFALSLTCAHAYYGSIAHTVAGSLHDRFKLHNARRLQIETCLHEALINAIVHGCLQLESKYSSQMEFQRYYDAIEAHMQQEQYGHRRIGICVWNHPDYVRIAVSDEGQGFDLPPEFNEPVAQHHKSGHGLFLVRSLADRIWLGEDRRTLNMVFLHGEEAA